MRALTPEEWEAAVARRGRNVTDGSMRVRDVPEITTGAPSAIDAHLAELRRVVAA